MTQILTAKEVREVYLKNLFNEVEDLKKRNIIPQLKIFLVGEDEASDVYVRNKKKFAEKINARCEIVSLDKSIEETEFKNLLFKEIKDPNVHGILIQLPLPKQLKHIDLSEIIPKEKDVDGFHYENMGKLLSGSETGFHIPCTPKGIITLLDFYKIPLLGKNVVIIGRSNIVGRPLAQLLINRHATVTICHSKTPCIKDYTKRADMIIVAVGKVRFLTKDYLSDSIKPVIIDVGTNNDENGNFCGDVDYENVKEYCSAITPVPGGVGPLTILSLAQNLVNSAKNQNQ